MLLRIEEKESVDVRDRIRKASKLVEQTRAGAFAHSTPLVPHNPAHGESFIIIVAVRPYKLIEQVVQLLPVLLVDRELAVLFSEGVLEIMQSVRVTKQAQPSC